MNGLTFVQVRNGIFKVNERRNVVDAVLAGFSWIVDLDEVDAVHVAFVIDVLQFGQHIFRLRIVSIIFNNFNYILRFD
jgi:hypothetical protein